MKTTSSKSKASSARKPAKKATQVKATARGSKASNHSDNYEDTDHSKLHKLFIDELKDIYWAEKALSKALPKMAKQASSDELIEAIESHLEQTEGHIERCEQIFEMLDMKPQAKKCEAMEGLIDEAEEIMEDTDEGVMRDAGIISAGQKVEHYEIATYGTLRQFAKTLGLDEIAGILEETLNEEKAADQKLTEVAEATINVEAAHTMEEEEVEQSR